MVTHANILYLHLIIALMLHLSTNASSFKQINIISIFKFILAFFSFWNLVTQYPVEFFVVIQVRKCLLVPLQLCYNSLEDISAWYYITVLILSHDLILRIFSQKLTEGYIERWLLYARMLHEHKHPLLDELPMILSPDY